MRTRGTVSKFFGVESGQMPVYENTQNLNNPPLPEPQKQLPLIKNPTWEEGYAVIMGKGKQEQGVHTRAYLGNKHQHDVGMQVLVSPEVREGINALAALHQQSTKDFLADLLTKEVQKNALLIPHGKQIEAERKKRPVRTHLQAVKEETDRLRALTSHKSTRSI